MSGDGTSHSPSWETDISSVSNGLSAVSLTEMDVSQRDFSTLAGSFDTDTKTSILKEAFPSLRDFTVSYTLKKCNGDWDQSFDELLNQVFITEQAAEGGNEGISAKSIDAFSQENIRRRGRKTKRKGKNLKLLDEVRSASVPAFPDDSSGQHVNKWQNSAKDIALIASKSGVTAKKVSSLYYSNGASISSTVAALLKDYQDPTKPAISADPWTQQAALELGQDFPTISPDYLVSLVRLTYPSTADAHELAKLLTTKSYGPTYDGSAILPTYAPLNLSEDEAPTARTRASRTTATSPVRDVDFATASHMAGSYSAARSLALAQAQAAYRKSRSDRLMAGAAGYYGQVSRDLLAASQGYTSAAADALVSAQSSRDEIDLHGVNVADGLRIAKDRVEAWWAGLGEARVNGRLGAGDRQKGFRIVTGVGRHSEGGRGKLGPAVGKMLAQEGWKVEAGSGALIVKGRARS